MSDENNKTNGSVDESKTGQKEDIIVITKTEKASEERKKDKKSKKQASSLKWALLIFVLTFFISLSFSIISQTLTDTHVVVAVIILAVFIIISIVFDIIAVAVTACSYEPFLAMASRKIYGARLAVKIAKNAEKVASICSDVVGDVCGIISGALGALIVAKLLLLYPSFNSVILAVLFTASIAALTVGGKAVGKKFAMDNCQKIIFFVARLLSVFSFKKR